MKRRTFLTFCSASGLGPVIGSWAASPNETPNIASIGVGGKGWVDSQGAAQYANMQAFCDVNIGRNRKGGWFGAIEKWPKANAYQDWRELLDKEGDKLDGITVSTPDHMHAPITMTALKMGIAAYTQKPLTRTVNESRQITRAAKEAGVATQMGNQHHNGITYRMLVDIIRSGTIGKIKHVHTWSNRPVWPQGLVRPSEKPEVPDTLDWNLWLGGAPDRPYHPSYQPFAWRGWFDFGAGALGDMGAHIIDPPVWALELDAPLTVAYEGPDPRPETFPESERIHYVFKGTKYTKGDQLKMTWHDGKLLPDLESNGLPADTKLPSSGSMFVGEHGTLMAKHGSSDSPVLYPQEKFADFKMPQLEKIDHYKQWVDAIRGEGEATSNFAYAGPLTETVLLGTIVCRFPGETLEWDAKAMKFANNPAASKLVNPPYRKGWGVEGLT